MKKRCNNAFLQVKPLYTSKDGDWITFDGNLGPHCAPAGFCACSSDEFWVKLHFLDNFVLGQNSTKKHRPSKI